VNVRTIGYVLNVAMPFKSGTATLAAVFFLLCGVEVAHAELLDPVAENPSPLVSPPPLVEEVAAESDAVVADAKEAVDEVTEAADKAAGSVDAEAVVADATGAVDEAVADPKGTVENAVEQVSATVDGLAGDARRIVDSSPVGKVAKGVTDIVNPVVSAAQNSKASRSETAASAASLQQSPGAQALVSGAPKSAETQFAAPAGLTSRANPGALVIGSIAPTLNDGAEQALSARNGLPLPSVVWTDAFNTPVATTSHKASSPAPAALFAPPPPGDAPATAASVAGAVGAALLAALFGALIVLAPRTGRLARPGPILVRAEPCLSLPERPG
jgi:hypothetical protein